MSSHYRCLHMLTNCLITCFHRDSQVFVECEIKKLTESMASVKVDLSILEKYRVAATRLKERVAEFEEVSF